MRCTIALAVAGLYITAGRQSVNVALLIVLAVGIAVNEVRRRRPAPMALDAICADEARDYERARLPARSVAFFFAVAIAAPVLAHASHGSVGAWLWGTSVVLGGEAIVWYQWRTFFLRAPIESLATTTIIVLVLGSVLAHIMLHGTVGARTTFVLFVVEALSILWAVSRPYRPMSSQEQIAAYTEGIAAAWQYVRLEAHSATRDHGRRALSLEYIAGQESARARCHRALCDNDEYVKGIVTAMVLLFAAAAEEALDKETGFEAPLACTDETPTPVLNALLDAAPYWRCLAVLGLGRDERTEIYRMAHTLLVPTLGQGADVLIELGILESAESLTEFPQTL